MIVLKKILQESKDNKKVIGIRMYGDDENFWCGYIYDFNDDLVLIQHFTKYGQTDGLILEKTENIESIDSDNNYSSVLQYLIESQNSVKDELVEVDLPASENWQFDFLEKLKNTDQILSIEFEGDFTIYGVIESLDNEFLKIKSVGNLGELDGFSTYRLNDVTAIRIGSVESVKRKKLLEFNLRKDVSE